VAGGPGDEGDNVVNIGDDVNLLAVHYGETSADGTWVPRLDVGPTTDGGLTSRPSTDNEIEFEDLIFFGINFGAVSKVNPPPAASRNLLTLRVQPSGEDPDVLRADLWLEGDGELQGLGIQLGWDEDVVEPLGFVPGDILDAQGGSNLLLSGAPGGVDAALAGVRERGISGSGLLASFEFRVTGSGDPAFDFAEIRARGDENEDVEIDTEIREDLEGVTSVPQATRLLPAYPNPFNPQTNIAFDLARSDVVKISIYAVDGRLVKTVVDGELPAGHHTVLWQGRDHGGRSMPSGLYFVRFVTSDRTETGRLTLVR
jgi:hypothetical protein